MTTQKKKFILRIFWTILGLLVISAVLVITCICILKTEDRTPINVITIIGTILAVVGIGFTIYQQIHLINVTDAIKNTTVDIENQILNTHFEINILFSIKCIEKIEDCYTKNLNAEIIKIKLDDLHVHIIECKKIIEKYNSSDFKNNTNFTEEKYTIFCEADKKILRFQILIITTEYSIVKLKEDKSKKGFTNFIVDLKRDLNLIKKLDYSI